MGYLQALLGIIVFIAIAIGCSEDRRLPPWKLLTVGLGLQFLIAFIVFRVEMVQRVLAAINQGVSAIVAATEAGTLFVFGYLGGGPGNVAYPYSVDEPGATLILAFRVLP